MCLAIPAKVEAIHSGMVHCRVGDGETFVDASTMLLDQDVVLGDYVIIHAGFAIRKLDLQEARESLTILRELACAYEQEQAKYEREAREREEQRN